MEADWFEQCNMQDLDLRDFSWLNDIMYGAPDDTTADEYLENDCDAEIDREIRVDDGMEHEMDIHPQQPLAASSHRRHVRGVDLGRLIL
ncbi:hypothetical protein BGX27_001996, partial [Mortierella sp. AM989]